MSRARPALLVAAFLAAPAPARADVGPDAEWYFLVGANVGAAIEEGVAEPLLGAEASGARLFRYGAWYGAYADGLFDFRRDATRVSAGVEAGFRLIGADLGPVIELGDQTRFALRARAVLSGAWLTLYAGPVIRMGDTGEEGRVTGEVGVLLKFPIPLQGGELSPVR